MYIQQRSIVVLLFIGQPRMKKVNLISSCTKHNTERVFCPSFILQCGHWSVYQTDWSRSHGQVAKDMDGSMGTAVLGKGARSHVQKWRHTQSLWFLVNHWVSNNTDLLNAGVIIRHELWIMNMNSAYKIRRGSDRPGHAEPRGLQS